MQPTPPVEPTPAQFLRTAEIIPHPMMRVRFAKERLRHIANIQSAFGRRRLLNDAAREYRKGLERIAVAPSRIETEIHELKAALFRVHRAVPNAVFSMRG